MKTRPATITVWDGWTVLDRDGRIDGPMTFQAADVTVDEAADLADDLLGGPLVSVVAEVPQHRVLFLPPSGPVPPYAWTLRVRAFIETEAYEALYAAAELLAGKLPDLGLPVLYRLLDGELVPQASISPAGVMAATNENGS